MREWVSRWMWAGLVVVVWWTTDLDRFENHPEVGNLIILSDELE